MISIVLPMYNESKNVSLATSMLCKLMDKHKEAYEIIFVDDGSTDQTWPEIVKSSESNANIKGVSLSRNFGKERAVYAGLQIASGEAAIVMDGDLQHPAHLIPEMLGIWRDKKCDVVNGVKKGRKNEAFASSLGVKSFCKLYKIFTGISLEGASDFKLIDRKVIDTYTQLKERDLFFRGLIPWIGHQQEYIEFDIEKREAGITKWTALGRYFLAINAITSFSSLPLQFVTLMGFVFFLLSIVLGVHTVYMWASGQALEGFTTLILLILCIGSILMISLGIIGQYLSKIYSEVKHRPIYLLKNKVGFSENP